MLLHYTRKLYLWSLKRLLTLYLHSTSRVDVLVVRDKLYTAHSLNALRPSVVRIIYLSLDMLFETRYQEFQLGR